MIALNKFRFLSLYWILDVAVIAIALSLSCGSLPMTPPSHEECDVSPNHTPIQPNTPRASNSVPAFQAGDFVEVYEPKVHPSLAFPAQIVHVFYNSDGSFKYMVLPGFGRAIPEIDPSSVRAFKQWENKAEVMCDNGNFEIIPCTVLHHIPNSNTYTVSYRKDGQLRYKTMPFFRIRRIIKDIRRELSPENNHGANHLEIGTS